MSADVQAASGPPEVIEKLQAAVAHYGGGFACYAKRLDTGEVIALDGDKPMPPASTIKLAIMAEAYRQAAAGTLDLDERVRLEGMRGTAGSGVLRYLSDPVELSVRDIIRLMIIVSDNVATAWILRRVGLKNMHAFMNELGFPNVRLIVPPRAEEGPRGYGTATPRELATLLEMVANRTLVSPEASDEMADILSGQQYGDQIPRWLPYNIYGADRGDFQPVRVLNKTGFSIGVRADAAIVRVRDSGFVIATMSEGVPDTGVYPDNPGNLVNATAARIIWDHWYGDDESLVTPMAPLPKTQPA